MSHHLHLKKYLLKEKRLQLLIILVLLIMLPVLLYLLDRALRLRTTAAPDATLTLELENPAGFQFNNGRWELPVGTTVPMALKLSSGSNQVENMQLNLIYNHNLVTPVTANVVCTPAVDPVNDPRLPNRWMTRKYDVLDSTGAKIAERLLVVCSGRTFDPMTAEVSDLFNPVPRNFTGTIATIPFTVNASGASVLDVVGLDATTNKSLILDYSAGTYGDGTTRPASKCCSNTDVLGGTVDLSIAGVVPTTTGDATLAVSPVTGTA
ncbi:hypothetical protein HY468_06020, partial [Candidatus Roizmanbacteria bacterium]|nr:hypothetical protein [Candidatus Roizmanbacteria bacterium]